MEGKPIKEHVCQVGGSKPPKVPCWTTPKVPCWTMQDLPISPSVEESWAVFMLAHSSAPAPHPGQEVTTCAHPLTWVSRSGARCTHVTASHSQAPLGVLSSPPNQGPVTDYCSKHSKGSGMCSSHSSPQNQVSLEVQRHAKPEPPLEHTHNTGQEPGGSPRFTPT